VGAEADPQADEAVVITGAADVVRGFALELAAARGVRTIAAVAEQDRDTVLDLGATNVVTREEGDIGAAVRKLLPDGADVLIDTASLAAIALGALRDGGRFGTTTMVPESARDISVTGIHGVADAPALETLVAIAAGQKLHVRIALEFDLADVRAAYEEFASGPHRDLIVLRF
jgi:NADPH:quinone reductase